MSTTPKSPSRKNIQAAAPVGGGIKKVLYTLKKVRQIGVPQATKALTSKNTCKACGLGMGGQRGGMTNELGEFPSVCNKSVQAQSTDIQPPIPPEIFEHSISDLQELDERELASLGRLNTPLYKSAGGDRYRPITTEKALSIAADRLQATEPGRSFFYASGRSSNEAGFLLQLFARLYGTNNVSNCSFYCHEATGVALESTIGTGTATVELEDLGKSDFFLLIGANPASNHPRLLHQLKSIRDRGGEIVVINPAREPGLVKFAVPKSPASLIAGGTEIATEYLQPNIGTDYLLLQGIAKAVLEKNGEDAEFSTQRCNGFEDYAQAIGQLSWEDILQCGVTRADIEKVAEKYTAANNAIFAWGMGLTHHTHGVENIEQVANLALLRGMVGRPGAGLLPLRGHSNVQGIGTIGVKPVLAAEVFKRMQETLGVQLPTQPGLDTMASMHSAAQGCVDLAFVVGGNLYAATPNSGWAAQALGNIGTKIFLTTTLNRGHFHGTGPGESLVFPVCARDEEEQATTQESMFNFVRLSDGGIHRFDQARPESWIISQLGKQILADSPVDFDKFQSHTNIREAIAQIVPGLESLGSIEVARKEFHISRRILHTAEFNTEDGRASFAPICKTRKSRELPFVLSTIRSEGQFNSIIYEENDVYRGSKTRWCVLMSPEDIRSLELQAADRVTLKSRHGEMAGLEIIPFDLPPGNLMAYYPEANILTGTDVDPRSKTPAFKATPVEILRGGQG
jgi:molybdopterin-dependent oxidoreductase alpha subunit